MLHKWQIKHAMWSTFETKLFPILTTVTSKVNEFFLKSMSSQYMCGNIRMADELNKYTHLNSLAPGRFQFHFRLVIFKLILVNGSWGISYQIALRWMPLDLADDKSTLIQVMASCRQASSHYLSQCWPRSMPPNGVTRPQWVKHTHELPNKYIFTCLKTWIVSCSHSWYSQCYLMCTFQSTHKNIKMN